MGNVDVQAADDSRQETAETMMRLPRGLPAWSPSDEHS